jgi:hypothetical protein
MLEMRERNGHMGLRFNPPPGWPPPPPGFVPPPGWRPDPSWPPPPPGWRLWVPDDPVASPGGWPGIGPPPASPPPADPVPTGPMPTAAMPAWPGPAYAAHATGAVVPQPPAGPLPPGATPPGATPPGLTPPGLTPRPGTSRLAVAAAVLGLIGLVPLGFGCGVAALVRLRGTRGRGRGLAAAGLVLSGLWAAGLAVLVTGLATPPPRPAPAGHGQPGGVSVFALRPGTCFQNPPGAQTALGLSYVTVVPCTTAHNAQVFAGFGVPGSGWPGTGALARQADRGCRSRIAGSLARSKITASMSLRYFYPLAQSWAAGHRTITCFIVGPPGSLRSSLLRSRPAR